MRTLLATFALGCSHDDGPGFAPWPPPGLVEHERIAWSDGLHDENTEMTVLDDRILLVFRGGETGQIGSDAAHIDVFASFDEGASWAFQSTVDAGTLPGGRDIRDPKLVQWDGRLFLFAISRLPGGHYRDLLGQAWTIRAESTDRGVTWTDPVNTYTDPDGTFWGFWRYTARTRSDGTRTLFALGYDDGDTKVGLFASDDGVTWERRSIVVDSYADVPSEAELQFYGADGETAVALVRMDDQGILQDGETAICTAEDPFTAWECGRRVEQRFDGPTWLSREVDGARREFVLARKHLPCTAKRTALYELRGDVADPAADVEVCELEELPSAGDTAYTALAPLGGTRYLASWYSSTIPATGDVPWLEGTYSPSDIWVADFDLAEAPPDACHPAEEAGQCPAAPLPAGDAAAARSGEYRLAVAPVIFPAQALSFAATVTVEGDAFALSLQPLDATTLAPEGDPWTVDAVPIAADGSFTATLGDVTVPETAFPLLEDPFLTLHELVFDGVFTADGPCGDVDGYAQVLGTSPSDRIALAGSTFGATRGTSAPSACGD